MSTINATLFATSNSITASSISITSGQYTVKQAVTRFVPMKKTVDIYKASFNVYVALSNLSSIDDHHKSEAYLYYAQNIYHDEYSAPKIELFGFVIIKETKCYYTLNTGQRINKKLTGNTFSTTPSGAARKAIHRAERYLDILIRRGSQVSEFLKTLDQAKNRGVRELRDFEKLAKSFKNTDDIPSEAYRDITLDDSIARLRG